MRGLRVIAVFVVLIACTYVGVLFVEANREEVVLEIGRYRTQPNALGFVVMSATLLGLVAGALLGSFEILSLLMQNASLRKRLKKLEDTSLMGGTTSETPTAMTDDSPKAFSITENLP